MNKNTLILNNKSRIPEDFIEYQGETLISNIDHEIDQEVASKIKGNKLIAEYCGWNFHGNVWWQDNKWCCEVWQYHSWVETFICDTLEEIMQEVSSEYGSE